MGDPFDELPPAEAEKLQRAENRFREHSGDFNPYRDQAALAERLIHHATFQVYAGVPALEGHVPELALYCNTGRFRGLCSLAEQWGAEVGELIDCLVSVEQGRNGAEGPDPLQEEMLASFGLAVGEDTYIVGYPAGAGSPLVVRKDLLLSFLDLLLVALAAKGPGLPGAQATLRQLHESTAPFSD